MMATRKRKSKMGRPRVVQNPRRLAVDFERGDVEALEEIADRRSVSIAHLLREAVRAYLRRHRRR